MVCLIFSYDSFGGHIIKNDNFLNNMAIPFWIISLCSIALIAFGVLIGIWSKNIGCSKDKEEMGLEEFISESIIQLMNGITTAQAASEVVGGAVNPHLLTTDAKSLPSVSHGNTTEIKYNIALTKTKSNDGKYKFAVMFGDNGEVGRSKSTHYSDSSMTSMSFAVRVSLPLHDNRATTNFSIDELKAIQKVRKEKNKEKGNNQE